MKEFKRIPMLPEFRVTDIDDMGWEIYNERPEDKFVLFQMEELYLMVMQLTTSSDSWNGYAPMEYPLGHASSNGSFKC
jgi:hypothetical protein